MFSSFFLFSTRARRCLPLRQTTPTAHPVSYSIIALTTPAPYGTTTFTDGEAKTFVMAIGDQVYGNGNIVTRHYHLGAGRQFSYTGYVSGAEVELRTVALKNGV